MDITRIIAIVEAARADGRDVLLESEGLEVLAVMGVATPEHTTIAGADELSALDLSAFSGSRVVLKVLSPEILHKTDVGGIRVVDRDDAALTAALREMDERFRMHDVRGFLLVEHVDYDASLGSELLLGCRWTDDFGPVVVYGAGGIEAEFLAAARQPGGEIAIATPYGLEAKWVERLLERLPLTKPLGGEVRGKKGRLDSGQFVDLFLQFAEIARRLCPRYVSELEINPLVVGREGLLALDVLVRCGGATEPRSDTRPLHKIRNLLEPGTIGIIGVSDRTNPGRVILENLIHGGFDRARIHLVKPGSQTIEGCRCYPDIESIPGRLDLLILAVGATQVPELLSAVVEHEKAESIILIPGGLEEKKGNEEIVARARSVLERARHSDWRGPVINGGNSMGIRSRPGGYDATFIPDYKFRSAAARTHSMAFISQSGAFYVAKGGKLGLDPKYAISIGNQMDLTIGDYLSYLKDDDELEVFAVYAEGFKPLDGAKFIEAAAQITAQGKAVILYRAGRTAAGAAASASHTAAIAGDYVVNRELAKQAGVEFCETTADFEDLVKLFALLGDVRATGKRLGAISNAGFECVSVSDHLGDLELAELSEVTRAGLLSLLQGCRVEGVVDIRNPVDLTPIMSDAPFVEGCRLVLSDEKVDLGLLGCVPLTGALQTLEPGDEHDEDVYADSSVARRLVRLKDEVQVPWVAVVDGGPLFDPMVRMLEGAGIPTFRTADRALRLLSRYWSAKLGQQTCPDPDDAVTAPRSRGTKPHDEGTADVP